MKKNRKIIKTYGFDHGASRDVGVIFLEEVSKTITNGTCPGHHTAVLIIEEDETDNNDREEVL